MLMPEPSGKAPADVMLLDIERVARGFPLSQRAQARTALQSWTDADWHAYSSIAPGEGTAIAFRKVEASRAVLAMVVAEGHDLLLSQARAAIRFMTSMRH